MSDTVTQRLPPKYDRMSNTTTINMQQGVMNFVDLTDIDGVLVANGFGTHGFLPQKRLTNGVKVLGFQYDLNVLNFSMRGPMIFHYAIVRPKRQDAQTVDLVDFFRDFNNSRDLDFNAPIQAQGYNFLPINPNTFDILMHKTSYIPKATSTGPNHINSGDLAQSNARRLKGYVPFNQNILFEDDANEDQNPRPIQLIMWCAEPVSFWEATIDKAVDVLKLVMDVRTVFRDMA